MSVVPHPSPLDILYEDDDLLVVNKPPGISVHPSPNEPSGTLVDAVLTMRPEIRGVGDPSTGSGQEIQRSGIVHRLDKETSGVLAVAKNQATFLELKELFQSRKVEKRYFAIVDGVVRAPRGVIEKAIGRVGIRQAVAGGGRRRRLTKEREARTEFIVRKRLADATLLELRPTTGRMHQIRVHLKDLGHPVLGDKLYGGKRAASRAPRQMLHAALLSFSLRGGRRFTFEADPPQDFQDTLGELLSGKQEEDE